VVGATVVETGCVVVVVVEGLGARVVDGARLATSTWRGLLPLPETTWASRITSEMNPRT
jgi:hypothetical protein